MASSEKEMMLRAFAAAAGMWRAGDGDGSYGTTEELSKVASGLKASSEAQAEAFGNYSRVLLSSPVYGAAPLAPKAEASEAEETGNAAVKILGSYMQAFADSPVYRTVQGMESGTAAGVLPAVFRNALGMVPLARAVLGLFGGGDDEPEAPLMKFVLPEAMRFEAADGPRSSLRGLDYGQEGLPRAYRADESAGYGAPAAGPQVTVNVQAMDSRSFLDHKEEIARAVREAMLNTHSLNDVVSDL